MFQKIFDKKKKKRCTQRGSTVADKLTSFQVALMTIYKHTIRQKQNRNKINEIKNKQVLTDNLQQLYKTDCQKGLFPRMLP